MKKIYEIFMRIATVVFFMYAVTACSEDKTNDTIPGGTNDKTIAVTGINIAQKSAEMEVGESVPLTVTVIPEDATDKSYTWTSANPAVASIENDILTAHAPGKLTVTATTNDGKFVAVCAVSIAMPKIHVTGITVSPTTAALGVGEKQTLTVAILPEDATDKNYTWSSSNPEVASIANDIVTAHTVGTATITAISNDGGYTASCAVTVSKSKIVATGAGGYNLGDQWYIGSDNIILYLTTGSVTSSGLSLEGDGMALWLDMNAPKTGNMAIPAGTYTALLHEPGPDESQDFTFLPGVDMGAWGVVGAFIYKQDPGAADRELIMIEDGVAVVTVAGSNYTVNAKVKAAGEDYEFTYSGAITVTDGSGGGGGGSEEPIVEMKNLTHGEMGFYGKAYNTSMGSDYNNWTIYLADASFDIDKFQGTGELLQLEINTAGSVTSEITPGTYEIFTDFGPNSFKAFSAVPGFVQNGTPLGTWYIKDMSAEYGATSGSAKISKSGSNYTIEFEFRDDEISVPTIFKGTYTGPLSYYDYTKSNTSVKKAPARNSRKAAVAPKARCNFKK